jgi:hypothetical protein
VWTLLNPADHDVDGVSKFGSETPMKPPVQPEEIAPAFVFLAAPSCSSCLTGEISIIGGCATWRGEVDGKNSETKICPKCRRGREE